MKKKKIGKIGILIFAVALLTGCTTTLKDENNKLITNPETGQSVTKNILCKPTNESLIKIYEDNKDSIDISKLSSCTDFKISGEYEGLWTSIFVKPLAWLILKLGSYVKYYILSIIIITVLIRLIMYPLTQKTAVQSENMKLAQPDLNKLEEKYKDQTDKDAQSQKAAEMMAIYKKYNINPVMGCLTSLIQLPIFFAFLEAINRVPAIFEEKIFGISMGITPWVALKTGHWYVLILNVLIIVVTYFSFKLTGTSGGTSATDKQTNMMSKFMVVFIGFMSFSLPAAIAIYWIASSGFTVLQNLIVKIKRGKKDGKNK